jgi:hypothetical protein
MQKVGGVSRPTDSHTMSSKDPLGYLYGGFKTIHACTCIHNWSGKFFSCCGEIQEYFTHKAQHHPCGVFKNIHPDVGISIWVTKKISKNVTHTIQLLLCIRMMVGSIDHDGYSMVYLLKIQ